MALVSGNSSRHLINKPFFNNRPFPMSSIKTCRPVNNADRKISRRLISARHSSSRPVPEQLNTLKNSGDFFHPKSPHARRGAPGSVYKPAARETASPNNIPGARETERSALCGGHRIASSRDPRCPPIVGHHRQIGPK